MRRIVHTRVPLKCILRWKLRVENLSRLAAGEGFLFHVCWRRRRHGRRVTSSHAEHSTNRLWISLFNLADHLLPSALGTVWKPRKVITNEQVNLLDGSWCVRLEFWHFHKVRVIHWMLTVFALDMLWLIWKRGVDNSPWDPNISSQRSLKHALLHGSTSFELLLDAP